MSKTSKPTSPVINTDEALGTIMKMLHGFNNRLIKMEEDNASSKREPSPPAKPVSKPVKPVNKDNEATVSIIFEVPVSALKYSKNGEWINFPGAMEGRTVGLKGRKVYYKFGTGISCRKDQNNNAQVETRNIDEDILG